MKKLLSKLIPQAIKKTLINYRILSVEFAQYKSMENWACLDKNNKEIPWYTYPAIEYIRQLDFSDKTVFEYGSGNSTIFWAARSKNVIATEGKQDWYEKMKSKLPANVKYELFLDSDEYAKSIHRYEQQFDVIIIDGEHRNACTLEAIGKLKDDGFIILDNSDWHEKSAKLLRDANLIEVDMSGFGPINGYTWTTSFFFSRNVRLSPAQNRQPVHGAGGIAYDEKLR